jgi:precorrin-8X/cobalt-precorrin-8 methylmutase
LSAFDRYVAVDWSASNGPVSGRDSIWIGESVRTALGVELRPSRNPRTRAAAMRLIEDLLLDARGRGQRVMLGFDFGFGYPRGAATALTGKSGWQAMWRLLADIIEDDDANRSNRFEIAGRLNLTLGERGPHFWGHPPGRRYAGLGPTRPVGGYGTVREHRIAEDWSRGPQPVWKLSGAGAVGSQSLLGIPRLEQLRTDPRFVGSIAVWPFETGFELDLTSPVTLVEIYPSLLAPAPGIEPRDRAQVEACVTRYAELDAAGILRDMLAAPAGLAEEDREAVLREEGWIAGVGHEGVLLATAPPRLAPAIDLPRADPGYLRDPDLIYAQSFATIRAEADLSLIPSTLREAAIRMIHACGMTDLAFDIVGDGRLAEAVREALLAHAPILCDSEMVRAGIIARQLRDNDIVVTLNEPATRTAATQLGTTRSAAAIELWRDRLAGAVVVIGNAPTALFHLLDMLEAGDPRPAAIIAAPVGFVGAAESKERLIAQSPVPFLTVRGRRGGSAIASAAFNALAGARP